MNTKNIFGGGGAVALGLALIALPAPPASSQSADDSVMARLERKLDRLQAKLAHQEQATTEAEVRAVLASNVALAQHSQAVQELQAFPALADADEDDDVRVLLGDEGASWLGVELHEVTGEKAKEFKLPAERGVLLGKVVDDSPASKAGLKENDVITDINGQRVEGAAQFRRMIHEIPAGRSVQLTVWRDGRSQTVTATLGKSEERRHTLKMIAPSAPGSFAFAMPEIPEIPSMEWNGTFVLGGQPRLGIDAEDLSGQLGTFFGTPDGEGILVREVMPDSPAEKAGLKAGDVITSFDGERIHSLGDLREKLAAKREAKDKDRTVKLGVLRNHNQVSLSVELPAPASTPRVKRLISRRTSI